MTEHALHVSIAMGIVNAETFISFFTSVRLAMYQPEIKTEDLIKSLTAKIDALDKLSKNEKADEWDRFDYFSNALLISGGLASIINHGLMWYSKTGNVDHVDHLQHRELYRTLVHVTGTLATQLLIVAQEAEKAPKDVILMEPKNEMVV